MAEECLRNEVLKKSTPQVEDKFDELVSHYMRLFEHEGPRKSDRIDDICSECTTNTEQLIILSQQKLK